MKRAQYHVRQNVEGGVDTDDGVIRFSGMGLTVVPQAPLADGDRMRAAARRRVRDHRPERRLDDAELLAPFPNPGRSSAAETSFAKRIDRRRRAGAQRNCCHKAWFNNQLKCVSDPHGRIETGVTKKRDLSGRAGLGDRRARGTPVFGRQSPVPGAIPTPTNSPNASSRALVRLIYPTISDGAKRYRQFIAVKRPPKWSTPFTSRRSRRQAAGLWPVAHRNRLQKWAWSEKPHCKAISLSGASLVSIIN